MGSDFGKCVCAPDPTTDEISMDGKKGERDRVDDDSIDTDSSTDAEGSSSEGDGSSDESGSESETGEDDSSFDDDEDDDNNDETGTESSYSSERDKSETQSNQESYESSGDDRNINDRNINDNRSRYSKRSDHQHNNHHHHYQTQQNHQNYQNHQNHQNHHNRSNQEQQQPMIQRKGSLKDINPHKKKMQKQQDRLRRQLDVISNKNNLMEQQRNAGSQNSHSLFNGIHDEPTSIPVKRVQSNQYSYYDDHQDSHYDNNSNDSHSVRSLPQNLNNDSNGNKHKKIGSMADFDPAALQLIARNSKSLFDPNYTITTVDPQTMYPPNHSINDITVSVPTQTATSQTLSQPTSPQTINSAFNNMTKAMTPNTYQYDNNITRSHGYSYSVDWQHVGNGFPNILQQQGPGPNINNNMNNNLPIRRTNSNPSFNNTQNTSFDMIMPQNGPQIPYAATSTNTLNTVKIISDDSSSQHHIIAGGQYVEEDTDLPAMPTHNRSNSMPTITPMAGNDNDVFDISRAGNNSNNNNNNHNNNIPPFGALFHDETDKQQLDINLSDNVPNYQQLSNKSSSNNSNANSNSNSNHTQNTTEIKSDINDINDTNDTNDINDNIDTNIVHQDNNNNNNNNDNDNIYDMIPPTNISPIQSKKSSPVPTGIQTNLNTMAGFNALSQQQKVVNSLSDIKIHAKDPNAIPASPPIDSVYKPLPQSGMMSRLSQISESNGLSSITSTPIGYTPNVKDTLPETGVVNKSSNDSFPDNIGDNIGDNITDNNSDNNIPPQISTEAPPKRSSHLMPQGINPMNEALSSPSDDDDTVAQQWMDLHQMNIHDHNLPGTINPNPMLSMHTDISSDQDENEQEVAQWKQQNLNAINSNDILAPQSSDEDPEQDDHKSLPQRPTEFRSQYSSETNPSTDYIDDTGADTDAISEFPIDDNLHQMIQKHSNIKKGGGGQGQFNTDKRHSSLLRRNSLHKWKTDEVNNEVHDMQRQLQHMQDEEQTALMQEMTKLQAKAKKANQQQWIDQ